MSKPELKPKFAEELAGEAIIEIEHTEAFMAFKRKNPASSVKELMEFAIFQLEASRDIYKENRELRRENNRLKRRNKLLNERYSEAVKS